VLKVPVNDSASGKIRDRLASDNFSFTSDGTLLLNGGCRLLKRLGVMLHIWPEHLRMRHLCSMLAALVSRACVIRLMAIAISLTLSMSYAQNESLHQLGG
jgi:hypothetical protein